MKQLIYFITMSLILCLTTSQTNAPNPPKDLTVTGPTQEWQNVIDCLNKSREEYTKVVAAQNFLLSQLNKQLADTTKPKK